MPQKKKFRFAVQAGFAENGQEWRELARRVEGLGYSVMSMPDHFGRQWAAMPALATVAAVTSTLRVATMVLGNDYRHPVVCAKEAATLDVLSEGRLELGIGAGWMRDEYEQAGIAYPSAATRLDRLTESVRILKGLWQDAPFSFEGEHYQISNLDGQPKPVQRPHPPIVMGGGGKRMLRLAAQEANTVNLALRSTTDGKVDNASVTAEAVLQQAGWVWEAAKDRAEQPELGIYVWYVEVTDTPRAAAEEQAGGAFPTADSLLATPHALIGSIDSMCDLLQQRREQLGISYIAVQATAMDKLAPVVARLSGT